MKTILRITRNELRNLFYSPVAWFALIVFMVVIAIPFSDSFLSIAKSYWIKAGDNPDFRGERFSLTGRLSGAAYLLREIARNLGYFIPLLSMGLINREVNQGTIRLLYSTPVKLWQIIIGKYLGICLFNLLLIGIIAIFHGVTFYSVKNAEYGLLLSSLMAFYLLACTYSAIGLFMSSVSNYQIVSAILTFMAIFILVNIEGLWQSIDYVRDLTWFLSFGRRTDRMFVGLIASKDVIYFVLISLFFLCLSFLVLSRIRRHVKTPVMIAQYLLLFGLLLGLGYVSSRPSNVLWWDTTKNQRNTITPQVQQLLAQLEEEPMEVTMYCNLFGLNNHLGVPQVRNKYLETVWEKYLRFNPHIKFNYKYYYYPVGNLNPYKTTRQLAKEMAEFFNAPFSLFKSAVEFGGMEAMKDENFQLLLELTYKGRSVYLRTYDYDEEYIDLPDDELIANALNTLVSGKPVQVNSITGNQERTFSGFGKRNMGLLTLKTESDALVNRGFQFGNSDLNTNDIPEDTDILVLAVPETHLSDTVKAKIANYIEQGGNMLILGEPGKEEFLKPVLEHLGVQILPGRVIQNLKDQSPDLTANNLANFGYDMAEEQSVFKFKKARQRASLRPDSPMPSIKVGLIGVSGIVDSAASAKGFVSHPLLKIESRESWAKMGRFISDSAAPVFNEKAGDRWGPFTTAVALERTLNGRNQRIIVAGDADFLSNGALNTVAAKTFYGWLSGNVAPVFIQEVEGVDLFMKVSLNEVERIVFFLYWIMPTIVICFAAVLLIRRKRR